MLFRYAYRCLTEVSPRLNFKAARLWVWKGLWALHAYRKRLERNELFPPFLFFALTNACNLRCRGCWIAAQGKPDTLPPDTVDHAIREAAKQGVYFHTLLGGEPFLYPPMWDLIEKHPECYFQIITNGGFFTDENVAKIKRLGNVSPLLSIDGPEEANDERRGAGTYAAAIEGAKKLQRAKILYGVATVVTGANLRESLTEQYVQKFIDLGAMYLWYYVYRPVGPDPAPELCVNPENMKEFRTKLLVLRKRMPIILIDTYWTAQGQAVCPAAKGLGFHIGPKGSIEPCPPLSVAKEFLNDNDGNLFKTINGSGFLRNFQRFVAEQFAENPNGEGCVILKHPQKLAEFFRNENAQDVSGRDFLGELDAGEPKPSHLMDKPIPEDFWLYKILKKNLFFGMGAYG
ncbi:MAG: radical SAM protein [Planctomycetaceae bacterium]|nr:radical SAM protein [Planctomycetaceae bacterium]